MLFLFAANPCTEEILRTIANAYRTGGEHCDPVTQRVTPLTSTVLNGARS